MYLKSVRKAADTSSVYAFRSFARCRESGRLHDIPMVPVGVVLSHIFMQNHDFDAEFNKK